MSHIVIVHECARESCAELLEGFTHLRWLNAHQPLLSPYLSHGRKAHTEHTITLYFTAHFPGAALSAPPKPNSSATSLETHKDIHENEYKALLHRVRQVAVQLLHALAYLHERLYCHGALHPDLVRVLQKENTQGEEEVHVRVVGYGLPGLLQTRSVVLFPNDAHEDKHDDHELRFVAPEAMRKGAAVCSPAADIWAFGAVLCEMLGISDEVFLDKGSVVETVEALIRRGNNRDAGKGKGKGKGQGEGGVSNSLLQTGPALDGALADFVKRCLYVDSNDRDTAPALLQHAFITTAVPPEVLRRKWVVEEKLLWAAYRSGAMQSSKPKSNPKPETKPSPSEMFVFLCSGGESVLRGLLPVTEADVYGLAKVDALPRVVGVEGDAREGEEDGVVVSSRSARVVLAMEDLRTALEAGYAPVTEDAEKEAVVEEANEAPVEGEMPTHEADPASYIAAFLLRSSAVQKPKALSQNATPVLMSTESDPPAIAPPVRRDTSALDDIQGRLAVLLESIQRVQVRQESTSVCREAAKAYYSEMRRRIPEALRPVLWCSCLRVSLRPCDMRSPSCPFNGGVVMADHASDVVWALAEEKWVQGQELELEKQLQVDIPRCHSYHPMMQSRRIQIGLGRLLRAWALADDERVYMQGLDSVAACVLCLFPHDLALSFDVFTTFVDTALSSMFRKGNEVYLESEVKILWQMLAFHDPKLWQHLDEVGISLDEERTASGEAVFPHFVIPWVLTFFAHTFPVEQVWRVWDLFLLTDDAPRRHFPALFGVSVLVAMRSSLMQCQRMEQVLKLAKELPVCIPDLVTEAVRLQQLALGLTPTSLYTTSFPACVPSVDCRSIAEVDLRRILFVDTRLNDEYKRQRIRGSINVTVEGITSGAVVNAILKCRKDKRKQIVGLVCAGETANVCEAARALIKHTCTFVCIIGGELESTLDALDALDKDFVIRNDLDGEAENAEDSHY